MNFSAGPRYACVFVLLLLAALPLAAATYTVINTNDSGPGSLRQALLDADVYPGGHRIEFAIGSGPQTIQPLTPLPTVYQKVVIDGRTQPGYTNQPIIELNGSLVIGTSLINGLSLPDAEVYGLVVNQFPFAGIYIGNGTIRNCYVGTNIAGTAARSNGRGVHVWGGGLVTIGGGGPNDGNLISGNYRGIVISGRASVQGNTFGTNATRTGVITTQSTHIAFENSYAEGSAVGGAAPNLFAGGETGVSISYTNKVSIKWNYFGATATGVPFPIGTAIGVYQSSENAIVGNLIHGNTLGVHVSGSSLRNRISGNSMHGNTFGIDLSASYPYGVSTPNDADDSDVGPNNLMNFPILGHITTQSGQTTIAGTLSTVGNRNYVIELFSSPSCNTSGYGEGKTLIDTFNATSDGGGHVAFTRTVPAVTNGAVITATATSELEGTSEFSPCAMVEGPGVFAFKDASVTGTEGNAVNMTVMRSKGAIGAASVSYAVTGGTATAADITGGSGTLHFADGETSKTFTVQTTEDSFFEGDETITLALSAPTNGTTIGSPTTAQITIQDDDPPPTVTLHNVQVQEGDSGTKVVEVPITLSAPASVPFSVAYTTWSSWSALAGVDYVAGSGTVTFAVGENTKTIPVTIIGDTKWESTEYVYVRLTAYSSVSATVTIVDDDPLPSVEADAMRIPEGNGTSTAVVTLRATEPVSGTVRVTLLAGSAQPGSDFEPYSETVYFYNETTKSFPVTILGDTEPEPDETFGVRVVSYSWGIAGGKVVSMTIVNDDAGIGPDERWIAIGTSGKFTVRLAAPLAADVTIGLASDAPTAVSIPSTLVIPAGQISADFAVAAIVPGRTANIAVTLPPSAGGITRSVRARTYTKAALQFSPGRLSLIDGKTATVTVSLEPASSTPMTLGIRSTDAVEVPSSVTIPAGGSASFVVTAKRIGAFTIDAQLPRIHGNDVQSLYGSVIEEPQTPAILSITPSHGPTSGGTEVAITGANLRSECTVAFGGVAATSAIFTNATAMTAVTPAHAGGTVDVTLTCGGDSFTFPDGFGYVSEAPRVSNVTPSAGTTAGGTHVRVDGAHLDGSCWLFFGRFAATDVVVRNTESITGSTPPRGAGTSDVTVRCSGGTSTLPAAFTYRAEDDPAPFITDVVPSAAAPGELVTIRGLHFRTTDIATIDTTQAAMVDPSPESHVVRVPELLAGLSSVFVKDAFGHETTSGPVFSVLEARPPQITSVAPMRVAAGGELELTGDGFRPGYTFEIGGHAAAIITLDYTRAIVRVPSHASAGSHPVYVRNRAEVLAAIGPNVEIVETGLVVTSADPRCALTDGGIYAMIRGHGFTSDVSVTFDGVPSAEVSVIDDATLRVLVPPGAAGSARITVNGASSSATLTNGFTYASPFDPRGCGGRARTVRH